MKLAHLANHIKIYCGHEYTAQNLKFAVTIEPDNLFIHRKIIEVNALLAEDKPTLPSTMGDEKKMNPFLRCDETSFKSLRERKDQF